MTQRNSKGQRLYNYVFVVWHTIYLSTAIGLTSGGSGTVHTQIIHRTTKMTREQHK